MALIKWVRLQLDRRAAKQTEAEAKRVVANIDKSFAGLYRLAYRLGAAIGTAFGIRALIRFGNASVREAARSEDAWDSLAKTIENAGGNFEAMEGSLRSLGNALQEVTKHSDEEYAESLSRLITLTGDVMASTNNMGLVVNVAAQFFRGELAPAVELVGKVMNGNTQLLRRMGIHVESAQEALDILAKRSFGAAERAGQRFSGRLARLNNLWGEFKERLGETIIAGQDGASALDLLTNAVRSMVKWVDDNREALARFVTHGVNVAITAIRGLIDAIKTFLQFRGALSFTAGTAPAPLATTARGLQAQLQGFQRQRQQLERERADALAKLETFEAAGPSTFRPEDFLPGAGLFTRAIRGTKLRQDLQSINDQLQQIEDNAARAGAKLIELQSGKTTPGLFGAKPVTGKNIFEKTGEDAKEQLDIAEEFEMRFREARRNAIREFEQGEEDKRRAIDDTIGAFQRGEESARDMAQLFGGDVLRGLDPVTTRLETLDAEAGRLNATMMQLQEFGFGASDPIMQQYAGRLKEINALILQTTKAQQFGTDVAEIFGEAIGASMGAGLGPFAAGKSKQTALEAAEESARGVIALLNPFTAATAGAHFAMAGKLAALSTAWAALSSAFGSGRSSGGGAGLAAARGASGGASARAGQVGPEVHIHLDGEGYDALNPRVQKVTWGAMQNAQQRFGRNTKVHLHRGG